MTLGQHLIQLLLIQHGVFFGIGIMIYKAGTEGLTFPRIGFLALSCVPAFLQISWASQWEAIGMDPTIRSAVAFAIWLVLTVLILVGALRKSDVPPQPRLAATIKLMGATTYPLYLLHFHIGGAVLLLFMERGARPTVAITAALLVSLLAAVTIAKLAEPATRTFLDRLIGRIFPSTIQQRANAKTGGPSVA